MSFPQNETQVTLFVNNNNSDSIRISGRRAGPADLQNHVLADTAEEEQLSRIRSGWSLTPAPAPGRLGGWNQNKNQGETLEDQSGPLLL